MQALPVARRAKKATPALPAVKKAPPVVTVIMKTAMKKMNK